MRSCYLGLLLVIAACGTAPVTAPLPSDAAVGDADHITDTTAARDDETLEAAPLPHDAAPDQDDASAPPADSSAPDSLATDGSYCAGQVCCAEMLACNLGWDGGPPDADHNTNCGWCTNCIIAYHDSWSCSHCDQTDPAWLALYACLQVH